MSSIKLCGLSRFEDVAAVNAALPDYAGFVFASSRRQVDATRARRLRAKLDERIVPVGVFVDAPVAEVVALCREGVIAMVQLHGKESEAYIDELKAACKVPVIKALRVGGGEQGACGLSSYEQGAYAQADFLLFDGAKPGSGQSFDWSGLGRIHRPYFLAGGINLHTIEAALALEPYGIDVSSGIETEGRKDCEKMLKIVSLVHNYSERKGA
ncbi:MAG: phosphoribosylanthranilate isomerase [Coriobacteriales bacterium]|nr:phosphoribosylanthranilate isomerase [Coriobacteriales bacterium]